MKVTLIKADSDVNSNKFWEAVVNADNSVACRWGRVGNDGQRKTFSFHSPTSASQYVTKKVSEKTKEGYKEAKILNNDAGQIAPKIIENGSIKAIAKNQIKYSNCKVTESFIEELVSWNVHQIAAQSSFKVSIDTGQISLPSNLGVLTPAAISEARTILSSIAAKRDKRTKEFKGLVESYLMLVPQEIPRKAGWIKDIYAADSEISAQESLLDSLEGTLKTIGSAPVNVGAIKEERVFDLEMSLNNDDKVYTSVDKLFNSTKKSMHDASRLKLSRIFRVRLGHSATRYESCALQNPMELWHGTSTGNLLSILKSGLIVPTHASHGRAFGNGVYFSDQSTKALNYAAGYWSGQRNQRCFMFLADVKLGNYFVPPHSGNWLPKAGYHSVFAKAGNSGVINNEIIIPSLEQINLKYLCEFKE